MPPTPSILHGATMHHSARRSGMAAEWLLVALLLTVAPALAGTTSVPPAEPAPEAIAALIARLGDTDFQRREAASAELKAIGPAAVDALRPHLRAILMGIGCLLLAAISWLWLQQQRAALVAKSWDDYMFAISPVDPAALADVATQHPGTPAGEWADLIQAEMALDEGAELLFVDRDRAMPKLQAAADGYAALLVGRQKGLLAERAMFGLAKANESLGKVDDARQGYEAVASDYPGGALAGMARQRSRSLEGERAQEWYTWFAAQKMTPPTPVDNSPILGAPASGFGDAAPAGAALAPETETPAPETEAPAPETEAPAAGTETPAPEATPATTPAAQE